MTAITFDTLKFENELEDAGFEKKQAMVLTKAIAKIVASNEVVSKKDLKETELLLRTEFELKIAELKADLVKWMLGVSLGQAAIIISCIKLVH